MTIITIIQLILKAKIKNVGEWKAVLSAIDEIVEEAMFICNTDGITFRGMDPTHVSLLDITFPKSSFEVLECSSLPQFFSPVQSGRCSTRKLQVYAVV